METRGCTAEELAGRADSPPPAADGSKRVRTTSERRARSDAPCQDLPGLSTHDVFLNDTACWRNVPEKVWGFTIGGYQVIKKWLSYRKRELPGRPLTSDEAREVTRMAGRIAALILLQPELDANYQRVKAQTFAWKP